MVDVLKNLIQKDLIFEQVDVSLLHIYIATGTLFFFFFPGSIYGNISLSVYMCLLIFICTCTFFSCFKYKDTHGGMFSWVHGQSHVSETQNAITSNIYY